jgi:uncharacterized protein (DUF362 family)/Pyruvate/2-oxoacid:ferredoxin oxidoreductase delta subunit
MVNLQRTDNQRPAKLCQEGNSKMSKQKKAHIPKPLRVSKNETAANQRYSMRSDLLQRVQVCELTKMLLERGADVVLGDSPGGVYNSVYLNRVYDTTGLRACETLGASLNQNFSQKHGENPNAKQAKDFQYTAWLDDADAIIDFCKLKTHGQMGMTCAVKNFFGTIPGTIKPEYHYKYINSGDFADMLVDLFEYFKPRLCICDAVLGMEGNGPTMGKPRHIGALLASTNGHLLDLAGAKILGYQPTEIPTLAAAIERGLCAPSLDGVALAGNLNAFVLSNVQKTPAQQNVYFITGVDKPFARAVDHVLHSILAPFPKLHAHSCIGCSKCAQICPAKAITMKNKLPHINRSKCIHCFCCQEFCPKGAMRVGRSAIARFLNK